jgi:anti-sigma factor RsiW
VSAALRPGEEELHAYVDEELPEDRRRAVAAYLRDHPVDAERLAAYRHDGEAIACVFARMWQARASRPAPASSWRRATWMRVAAVVLVMVGTFAAGLGWYWRGNVDSTVWARFGTEALAAHLALTKPESPPRMAASLQDVAAFLSGAVKAPIRLNDPANTEFTLVGSRFLTGAKGRVAQLAFRSPAGVLVTMYFEPWRHKRDAPFRVLAGRSAVGTIGWTDRELGCAVAGALPPDELTRVGRMLYAGLIES